MSYYLTAVIFVILRFLIFRGQATDPGLKQVFEHSYPLTAVRPPHQYNLWWRLLEYSAKTEGLSDCYVCANSPHSTDKPFRLQPVPMSEVESKCMIWLQAMLLNLPKSSCPVWLSILNRLLSQIGVNVDAHKECASLCASMHSPVSISWVLHQK